MALRDFALEGRRVLVTGASSGIGRALALELARRGCRLAVAARRAELLESLADEAAAAGAPRPRPLVADLSRPGAAAELAQSAVTELGQVDVLVNNAGVGLGGSQWVVGDRDEGRELYETNLWSPLALISELVPPMRARGEGAVVNVTSMGQLLTIWGLGHYDASKAALARATDTLRIELRGSGVHVLELIPGPTETPVLGEGQLIPGFDRVLSGGPLGKPDVLARLAVRALERRRARLVYPRPLRAMYEFPALARLFLAVAARRFGDEMDADDDRCIRGGSGGDELARRAREDWARQRA